MVQERGDRLASDLVGETVDLRPIEVEARVVDEVQAPLALDPGCAAQLAGQLTQVEARRVHKDLRHGAADHVHFLV